MERTSVESSNLVSIGYDEEQNILEVEFKGNRVYEYYDVPASVYAALMSADSHGKYFSKFIRNSYSFTQLR
jgi:hypothetical protein